MTQRRPAARLAASALAFVLFALVTVIGAACSTAVAEPTHDVIGLGVEAIVAMTPAEVVALLGEAADRADQAGSVRGTTVQTSTTFFRGEELHTSTTRSTWEHQLDPLAMRVDVSMEPGQPDNLIQVPAFGMRSVLVDGDVYTGGMLGENQWVRMEIPDVPEMPDAPEARAMAADLTLSLTMGSNLGLDQALTLLGHTVADGLVVHGRTLLDGIDTVHIEAPLDPTWETAASDLNVLATPESVEVWLDGDGLPRQVAYRSVHVQQASRTVTEAVLRLFDWGADLDIGPPAGNIIDWADVAGG